MILRTFTRNLLRLRRITEVKPVSSTVCIDIECTCDSPVQLETMEIIEIACLKLDLEKSQPSKKVDECPSFHSYAKPKLQPQLTLFCQELTGITQPTIDKSDTVDKVVRNLMDWLKTEDLVNDRYERRENFAFASCGKLDQNILSPIIKDIYNVDFPWINVKKTFVAHKGQWPKGLYHMLELVGAEPTGRLHSAQDDCKNLAKIVDYLHRDGCKFNMTSKSSKL